MIELDIIKIIGGVAIFLFGMNIMGAGLEKIAGGSLQKLLEKTTSNIFSGIMLGMLVTSIIQSSSATTVIVVGFVNVGMMTLRQGIGVCIGANIGTTVTAWILSLGGIDSSNAFVMLFKTEYLAAICAFAGIIMFMFLKREKHRDIGYMLLGFAVLMFGMGSMAESTKSLISTEYFENIIQFLHNPLYGFLAGMIITAIIQSSSASIGMLQTIAVGAAATGLLTFEIAIPIILGQNVGTCITAVISAFGASKNAKRTAVANVYFNLFGSLVFMAVIFIYNSTIGFSFWKSEIQSYQIALIHTVFNLFTTILFIPLVGLLEKLTRLTIRGEDKKLVKKGVPVFEERFLTNPSIAIKQCIDSIADMSRLAILNYSKAIALLLKYDLGEYEKINDNEEIIDLTEDALGTYLIKINDKDLTETEAKNLTKLMHSITDYERIGDHAMNIADRAKTLNKRGLVFSETALYEISVINEALIEILEKSTAAYINNDKFLASEVEPLEEVIDLIGNLLKNKHIKRLQTGDCSIETGVIYLDLLNDFERIADHCSNIAVYTVELREQHLEAHEYLKYIKNESPEFAVKTQKYSEKYIAKLDV